MKQLVAEQLRTTKDRRGFARQEWAKLRERNEALDCAVYARAALWLLGADRYGDRFWAGLREVETNAASLVATVRAEAVIAAPQVAPARLVQQAMRAEPQQRSRGGYMGSWR